MHSQYLIDIQMKITGQVLSHDYISNELLSKLVTRDRAVPHVVFPSYRNERTHNLRENLRISRRKIIRYKYNLAKYVFCTGRASQYFGMKYY